MLTGPPTTSSHPPQGVPHQVLVNSDGFRKRVKHVACDWKLARGNEERVSALLKGNKRDGRDTDKTFEIEKPEV